MIKWNIAIKVLCVSVALSLSACSSDDTNSMTATDSNDDPPITPDNPSVTLAANVVQWDARIRITYTLINNSADDLVAFDGPIGNSSDYLIAELLEGDKIRLYKGKFTMSSTLTAVTTPLVGGRVVMPDGTLEGMGSIDIPVTIASPTQDTEPQTFSPTEVEFCVGYSRLADVADTVQNDSDYPQTENLDLQILTCTLLSRP